MKRGPKFQGNLQSSTLRGVRGSSPMKRGPKLLFQYWNSIVIGAVRGSSPMKRGPKLLERYA